MRQREKDRQTDKQAETEADSERQGLTGKVETKDKRVGTEVGRQSRYLYCTRCCVFL